MEERRVLSADLTGALVEDFHDNHQTNGFELHSTPVPQDTINSQDFCGPRCGCPICSGMANPLPADPVNPEDTLSSNTPVTLSETFLLNSNPGASHTIFLDFDGHVTTGTVWNSIYAGGVDISTPAFDFDGNTSSFSNAELQRIQWIWERVAEDYMPFDVNVTTEDPGVAALSKSGASDSAWGARVVIGGSSTDWYGASAGGVAYVGSFNWSTDTPGFVFEAQLGNGNEKFTAEAISHEAGHMLGLGHDGRTSPSEGYYKGHGSGNTGWAPIMGNSYSKNVTQWSKGEYANANQLQDDLAIISGNNGFSYRADDHANANAGASTLTITNNTISDWGIIERTNDVDVFSFTPGAGSVQIDVNPLDRGPNLDVFLELYDSSNTLVASSNPVNLLSASISATLTSQQYFLHVSGTGNGNPLNSGYSPYASLGQFFVSGTFVPSSTITELELSGLTTSSVEGNTDSTAFTFAVNRTGDTSGSTTVDYIVAGTGSAPAVEDDFVGSAMPSGSVVFAPGETSKTITVQVAGDTIVEDDEEFSVTLGNASGGAVINNAVASGVILNDDTATVGGSLNFNDYVVGSYGYGQDTSGNVTVENGGTSLRIVGNSWKQIQFPYTVTPDTVLEFDFSSSAEGEIHAIGFDTQLNISGNRLFELYGTQTWGRQDFRDYGAQAPLVKHYKIPVGQFYTGSFNYLAFANDHDVRSPDAESLFANVRIYEKNASQVSIAESNASRNEGDSGAGSFTFAVNRTGDTSGSTTVDYIVAGTGSAPAVADDFVGNALPSGTVLFAPGETSKTITVQVAGDTKVEDDEEFSVTLGNASGSAVLVNAVASGIILNDDTATVGGALNFNDYVVGSYGGGQDASGNATVENGGASLRIVGNSWKQIQFSYTVTPDTVLEFDFSSSAQGEIHAIGFDTQLNISGSRLFELYGTQTWGRQDFRDYGAQAPLVKHYKIPVGQFYTGSFSYLAFANDHDVRSPDAESLFANVKIYENNPAGGLAVMAALPEMGSEKGPRLASSLPLDAANATSFSKVSDSHDSKRFQLAEWPTSAPQIGEIRDAFIADFALTDLHGVQALKKRMAGSLQSQNASSGSLSEEMVDSVIEELSRPLSNG